VLLAAHGDLAEPDHLALAQRIADDPKGILGHLVLRHHEVRPIEV
jgi:hypothetical protein